MANSRGIRAGRAFVELGVSDRLSAGLRAARKRLRAFGAGVRQVGLQLVAAGGAAVAGFAAAVGVFVSAGDQLDKMAKRTGLSVEALSELKFAAEQSGTDIQTLEKGVRTLARTINDAENGLGTATKALAGLGLTVAGLKGLSPEEQFKLIADALSRIEDPGRRAALAMEVFGKSGAQLLPLMLDGARGIEALQAEARRLGLTISTETAGDAARLGDALDALKSVLRVTAIAAGGALAPALEAITMRLTTLIIRVNEWIKKNREVIITAAKIAAGVVTLGSSLVVLGTIIVGVGAVLGGLATIISGVAAAAGVIASVFAAIVSPIGLVVAAVAAAGAAFLRFTATGRSALAFLGAKFGELASTASSAFGGVRDALAAGDITLAAKVLLAGLKVLFLEGTSEIRETFAGGLLVMRLAFVDVLGSLSRLWVGFTNGLRSVWEKTQNLLAKGFIAVLSVFDLSLNVDDAFAALDAESKRNLDAIAQRTEDALRAIDRDRNDRNTGLLGEAEKKAAERAKALEDARRELAKSIEEARKAREDADRRTAEGPSLRPGRAIAEELDAASEMIARKIEARGTFNAFATLGLELGSRAIDRTANATEQTARNMCRLVESARDGGLTFA